MKHRAEHESGSGDGVRVIAIGRTELLSRLRRRADVELVRAPDGAAAIAELASPIDEFTPTRSAILVGRTNDPSGDGDATAFVEAVRRVDPGARTVIVGAGRCEARAFDAVVEERSDDADLDEAFGVADLAASNGEAVAANAEAEDTRDAAPPSTDDADTADEDPAPGAADEPREPAILASVLPPADTTPTAGENSGTVGGGRAHASRGDTSSVLDAVLRGRDVAGAAVDAIRRSCAPHDVYFAPGASADVPADARRVAPVQRNGRRFGWLFSPSLDADALEQHADELAGWLALERRHRGLRRAAFTDRLTGAHNRRYYEGFIERALREARAQRRTITVLLFDIDDFKTYNDRYGHAAGDSILVHTVRLLRSVIRPSDRVCRIGGDEFVVVFDDPLGPRERASEPLRAESIHDLTRRFQRQIQQHRFPELGILAAGALTISGGLATFPWDGADADSLLRRADELAMHSKRRGKNVITLGPGAERACRGPGRSEDGADEPRG